VNNRTVVEAIAERAEPTILLTLFALTVSLVIGLPTGIISALRRGRWVDTLVMFVAIIGVSMPTFWLGLNLIYVFAVSLRVLPLAGYQGLDQGLNETARYLVMPAITLGLAQGALLARMTRSMMLVTCGRPAPRA
jgi:peptide/nickel transport system permease protein